MKPTRSFRIDENLLKEAKRKNLDLTKIIESALRRVLLHKCPYCDQMFKKDKVTK